jgi:hypothetical protein
VSGHEFPDSPDRSRANHCIIIEEENESTTCLPHTAIAGKGKPGVSWIEDELDKRIALLYNADTVVMRLVVYDNNLILEAGCAKI